MEVVSDVFDTNPRNGNRAETIWYKRLILEQELENELFTRGRHICVDGCSGSGKSSLVITQLLRHSIPYTTVQVTRRMDWIGLCKNLIQKPSRVKRSIKGTAGAEWKGLFPTGKLQLEFGGETDIGAAHDYWEKLVASATEHDIARAIAQQDCVVVIDEFERASPELANSVSEVCKILTQTYSSRFGRIIILGSDDVYRKLYDAYSTLDNRLVQISIPTLPGPKESWAYLKAGFQKLNKFHPGNSHYAEPGDERKAIEAIYNAADGLFKSLTELGVEICRHVGPSTRGITLKHIESVCARTEDRNFSKYREKFALLHRLAAKNPATVAVITYMNQRGLGQIHEREQIESALETYGKGLIEDAILALWNEGFLVLTGESNQKIFVKNPSWAHTFRVYLSDPVKKRKLEKWLEKPVQFALDMGIDWDSLETDISEENCGP